MRRFLVLLLACSTASAAAATTGADLRSRIVVDGLTGDFEGDEWVLDQSTSFRERPDDSRWGRDNDVRGIAVTWDRFHLYVAVPAVTTVGTLFLVVDAVCGGLADLLRLDYFSRNVEFAGMTPDFLVRVERLSARPVAGRVDCSRPFDLLEEGRFRAVYRQDGANDGALELAVPWNLLKGFEADASGVRVPSPGALVRIAAFVTGGEGTGAGDAAPDPSVTLEGDSTRSAVLDNHAILPLDADGDGLLDFGVSPRHSASFAVSASAEGAGGRRLLSLRVPLERKIFSPTRDGEARFPVVLDSPERTDPVYLTARVYSSAGALVRTLVAEDPVDFSSGTAWISWSFEDDSGRVVPGGVYILAVSGGVGKGTPEAATKAVFAVVR